MVQGTLIGHKPPSHKYAPFVVVAASLDNPWLRLMFRVTMHARPKRGTVLSPINAYLTFLFLPCFMSLRTKIKQIMCLQALARQAHAHHVTKRS